MNKKFLALAALGSIAGTVLYRCLSSRRQANEYTRAISEALKDAEVTDFERFSEYLLEYYGIIAKNVYGNVVEYSSHNFNRAMTSDEIWKYGNSGYGYNMDDLEIFFSSNRELWV